jgi:hypothetical protein
MLYMKSTLRTWLVAVLSPKPLIFAFALFNFILIWTEARNLAMSGIACVVCPWYHPWSYSNEPTRLLVAACSLCVSRGWSYAVALALTGYMIALFAYQVAISGVTLRQEWAYLQRYEPYLVGSADSQYIFAVIAFCFAIFYLARGTLGTRLRGHAAANKALQLTAR